MFKDMSLMAIERASRRRFEIQHLFSMHACNRKSPPGVVCNVPALAHNTTDHRYLATSVGLQLRLCWSSEFINQHHASSYHDRFLSIASLHTLALFTGVDHPISLEIVPIMPAHRTDRHIPRSQKSKLKLRRPRYGSRGKYCRFSGTFRGDEWTTQLSRSDGALSDQKMAHIYPLT